MEPSLTLIDTSILVDAIVASDGSIVLEERTIRDKRVHLKRIVLDASQVAELIERSLPGFSIHTASQLLENWRDRSETALKDAGLFRWLDGAGVVYTWDRW